jgi:tRNA U34 5-carboxymethylaminomethyl modifying enzyme MnmG/GidA
MRAMTGRYDAIVVGGGHNGLVAATHRARGGLESDVMRTRAILQELRGRAAA